jgi:HEAT repeat protein
VGLGIAFIVRGGLDVRPTSTLGQTTEELITDLRGEQEVRTLAREKLLRLGLKAIPLLIEASDDEDAGLRWEAVNLLGSIGDKRSSQALVSRVLEDGDSHVRWRNIWAISSLNDELTTSRLSRPKLVFEHVL